VNGDFETGNTSGWTTFVNAAGASFTASSTQPKSGSYAGNLRADFSAGNGGAVDAVVKQANVGAGGKVTQIPIMLFRLICVDLLAWVGFCGIFLRAIWRRCFQG
jgi:hypothetical protein